MISLECKGAASGEVTGSSHILTGNHGKKILVDCGLIQGTEEDVKRNYERLTFDPRGISAVIASHAHADHIANLPRLIQKGFKGKIYATPPSRKLIGLILKDSLSVSQQNSGPKLYNLEEINKTLKQIEEIPYDQEFDLGDFKVVLRNAGHILGSAIVEITEKGPKGGQKIVFSGDLGNATDSLVGKATDIYDADIIVMETTYGGRNRPQEDPLEVLQSEINIIESKGSTLVLPSFAVHRSQKILAGIGILKDTGKIKKDTPVFFDSPMAERATEIYRQFRDSEYFTEDLREQEKDPFQFEGLFSVSSTQQRREIFNMSGPKVIIAGAGMMTGGRILSHAARFLPDQNSRFLFVGYQGEGTLGREISEGAKEVVIDDKYVAVKATINMTGSMSSHMDQSQLLDWVKGNNGATKKICLVHGEQNQRETFAMRLREDLGIQNIELPERNQPISLQLI